MRDIKNTLNLIFIIIGLVLNAQQGIQGLLPVSPELETFYRYGGANIDQYKGRVNFSIPIYNISYGDIQIPITLNYNSNGIRVDEEAGFFGLGWHFDLGTASQVVLGKDNLDPKTEYLKLDYIKLDSPEYVYEPVPEVALHSYTTGYSIGIENPIRHRFEKYTGSITPNTFSAVKARTEGAPSSHAPSIFFSVNNRPYDISGLVDHNTIGHLDSERDILLFNFMGHNVKAYLGNGVNKLTKDRYSIERIIGDTEGEISWQVIDPNGIKYLFEHQIETWRDDVSNRPRWHSNTFGIYGFYKKFDFGKPTETKKSSIKKRTARVWKLTSIEDTNGNIIEIIYKRLTPYKVFKYSSGQTIFMDVLHQNQPFYYNTRSLFSPREQMDKIGIDKSGYEINSKEIGTTIGTEQSVIREIRFGENKLDFRSSSREDHLFAVKIDKVNIYSGSALIQENEFKYSYFNSNHPEKNQKRLKLDEVKTLGKSYKFGYYLPTGKLPDKNSNAFDYWGFYNGQDQNTTYINDPFRLLTAKQQDAYFGSGDLTQLVGQFDIYANRSAVTEFSQYGILNEIEYPTGGKTKVEYELNTFNNYFFPDLNNNRNFLNGKYQQRYQQTQSSGYGLRVKALKNFDLEKLVSITSYKYIGGKHLPYSVLFNNDSFRKVDLHMTTLTRGLQNSYDSNFILTSYYKSSPYMDFLSENDGVGYDVVEREIVNYIDTTKSYKEVSYFFNNPLKSPREIYYNDSPSVKKGDIDLFGYGINTNVIENGSLSKKEYFDESGKLIKRNEYFYQKAIRYPRIDYNVKFANTRTLVTIMPLPLKKEIYQDYMFFFYPLYMPQSILEWEKETLFFNENSISNYKVYNYSSEYLHEHIYLKETNPYYGQTIKSTKFKYASDYSRNIINRIASKHIKKNGQTAVFEEFRYHPGTTNIKEKETRVKYLYNGSNIKENYNKYVKGKPQEYTRDDIKSVYLYGYTKQHLIAQIQNATFSEVATALGVSETALEGFNENHIGQINGLRAQKPEWMITTYTHIPLVGIKTVTDPRGRRTTYEYDEFNRLKHIKDHDGNIMEAYDYNYKNQQP